MIECPTCQILFLPRDSRQRCCSKRCGIRRYGLSEARKLGNQASHKKHKNRHNKARRERYQTDEVFRAKVLNFVHVRRKLFPEKIAAAAAKYRAKPKNRKHAAVKSREWHAANKEQANPRRQVRKQKERVDYPWKGPLDAARRRAAMKKLPFDLTDDWCRGRWTGRCEMSDIPFRIGARGNGPKFFSASIDQITPKGGYTQNNCRFVLWAVNAFKYDGTDANVFAVARAITERAPTIEGILSLPV